MSASTTLRILSAAAALVMSGLTLLAPAYAAPHTAAHAAPLSAVVQAAR